MSPTSEGRAASATPEDALSDAVRGLAATALEQLEQIQRADGPELDRVLTLHAVHQLRTSLRRLRSVQRVLVSPPLPGRQDQDLRAVARGLGELRDLDVLGEELTMQLDALPPGRVGDSARHDLAAALSVRRGGALLQIAALRGSPQWRRALAVLSSWQRSPSWNGTQGPLARLEDARAEVGERLRTAGGDPRALHAARRAAKRWRYAAEALLPALPGAGRHYEEATAVHTRLGRLQDAVVAAEFLDGLLHDGDLGPGTDLTLLLLRDNARRTIEEITAETLRRR